MVKEVSNHITLHRELKDITFIAFQESRKRKILSDNDECICAAIIDTFMDIRFQFIDAANIERKLTWIFAYYKCMPKNELYPNDVELINVLTKEIRYLFFPEERTLDSKTEVVYAALFVALTVLISMFLFGLWG